MTTAAAFQTVTPRHGVTLKSGFRSKPHLGVSRDQCWRPFCSNMCDVFNGGVCVHLSTVYWGKKPSNYTQ